MAEATIRRHIAALVDAGLLIRRDSANGKRFARRDSEGDIGQAFGFSLAPLLQRAEELAAIAAAVVAERLHYQGLKERLTICRRDIVKLLQAAADEEGDGDMEVVRMRDLYRDIMAGLPRHPDAIELEAILNVLDALRENLAKFMCEREKSKIIAAITIKLSGTNRIQIHNLNMNLNLASKRSRGKIAMPENEFNGPQPTREL